MQLHKIFFLCILLFLSNYTLSQNSVSTLFTKAISQLKINPNEIEYSLAVEKKIPNKPNQSIIVFPKYNKEKEKYGNLFNEFDSYILIIDNTSGIILHEYIEQNIWSNSPEKLEKIEIDTGLYNLNNNTRAFGVRVSHHVSEKLHQSYETNLSLYITENNKLKKILNKYPIYFQGGEMDLICTRDNQIMNSTIDIDKSGMNNFHNLIIRTTVKDQFNYLENNKCLEKQHSSKTTTKLKYNNTEYIETESSR